MARYDLLKTKLLLDLEACMDTSMGDASADLYDVYASSLKASFYKKFLPGGSTTAADKAALDKFRAVLPTVGLRPPSMPVDDDLLSAFHHQMERLLGWRPEGLNFDFESISDRIKPGPGASRKQDSRDFVSKYFQGPLSATDPYVLALYRAAVSRQPSWAAAEMQRSLEFPTLVGERSRISFAKKNAEVSRVICTECGANMMLQGGISGVIETRLKEVGIDLSIQSNLNKELARLGSIDGSLATEDLRSASDSISLELVQRYVPMPLRSWLLRTRSPVTILPDRTELELPMVSTMGNGFTFSLMTAIFTCVVKACHVLKGLPFHTGMAKRWGVFGDDIIVPTGMIASVRRLLHLLGFQSNLAKSFDVGPFRESCGGDYFLGHDVRGVYLYSLDTDQDIYSALNRLNRWSARSGLPLPRTVRTLLGFLRGKLCRVPRFHGDDAGYHVPSWKFWDHHYWYYQPKGRKRTISPETGEYDGYGDAIYVGMLGGYVSTEETKVSERPEDGKPSQFHRAKLAIGQRSTNAPLYNCRRTSTYFGPSWDWEGLQSPREGCEVDWEVNHALVP